MKFCPISNALLFVCLLFTWRICSTRPTNFTGDVFISCSATGTHAAHDGRQWLGDVQPKLSSLLQINGKSTTSTVTDKLTLDDPVPQKIARISRTPFSYAFRVDPGQKIIRRRFNPSPYKGFREFKDLFTVQSGRFTLLRYFNTSFTADALAVNGFAFCLNKIQQNQQLTITFSPETSNSLDAYAFINAIEILVVPAALSYFGDDDVGLQVVGEKCMVYVDNNTMLEIIQLKNLKQDPFSSNGDLDSMFPKWATQEVDKKKNSTWKIPVKVRFRYLVRLHFSEVGLKIAGTGEPIFMVFINDRIAQTNSDILTARDGNYLLLHRDYIVMMPGLVTDGKRDILISIRSYEVRAGFQDFSLSYPKNSLASPNPLPRPQDSPSTSTRYLLSILGHLNATSTLAIAIISLINIIVYKLRLMWEASRTKEDIRQSDRPERLFPQFSLFEIQVATRNFNEGLLIGKGGFGKVYKGIIRGNNVAVKRLKSDSKQGAHEFLTEIETLSKLRHINLVSLIGYCKESKEMILVYEYMPNGTLADHLYKIRRRNRSFSSLTWKQRLCICIESGRGLDYLHTGQRIIHRDVKPTNILLDENFVAKVSDFGLAKAESLKTFVEVAGKCLNDEPKNRPTMSQVVLQLESALEQQENRILAMPNQRVPVAGDQNPLNEDIITSYKGAKQPRRAAATECDGPTIMLKSSPKIAGAANKSSDMCRYFSFHEIRKATDDFNENLVINKRGFAYVYKGLIDDGATTVAIKRLNPSSYQGASEFLTEIEILSKLSHRHLVSLIGYCDEKGEMIKVYEYMAHGTLHEHLHNSDNPPLTWERRLQICLGAAKGLDYLHTGAEQVISHGDVNTANILLDEQWVAKVYDIVLSEALPLDSDQTLVKGTHGYLDPEYYRSMRLTVQADVYSFGVLLFEVLSARKPIIPSLPRKQVNLIEWGTSCFRKGKLDKIIDSNLKGQIAPKCLNKFVETAVACLSPSLSDRPEMRDVIGSLESAMQLQEGTAIDGGNLSKLAFISEILISSYHRCFLSAPPHPKMLTAMSHINLKESKFEHGSKSRWTQKDKLLSPSEQSDDSSNFLE